MSTPHKLALCGGKRAFAEALHVGRPAIANRRLFLQRTAEILDRSWLSNYGPMVQEFEQHIAEFLGVKHCVCVCNATIGLEIAFRAAGLKGEVIIPSFTFVATAHSLQWQGISPVFVDIDAATHNLDPTLIERQITSRTTAIVGTHLWGRPCAVEALAVIADRRGLKLIFDAAHAFGCSYRGRMIGGFGLAEVFSFHATKFLNSFEGGAIATNDDELATRARLMTNFGFAGYDDVVDIGTNGKMSEVSAAMGLTNLEHIDKLIAVNYRNYKSYQESLKSVCGLYLCEYDEVERGNYQYIVVEVDETKTLLNRDELVAVLHAENILARKYFWPGCHRMEPYRSLFPDAGQFLMQTERVAARVILLPTGLAVSPRDIRLIVEILAEAVASPQEVRLRLRQNPPNSNGK